MLNVNAGMLYSKKVCRGDDLPLICVYSCGQKQHFYFFFNFIILQKSLEKNCTLETWIKVRVHHSYVYQQGLHTGFIDTNLSEWNTRGLQKCFLLSDFFCSFSFLKHIFHSYHFVFTQVIYVLILKCAWSPSIFKCSKTKTSGRE